MVTSRGRATVGVAGSVQSHEIAGKSLVPSFGERYMLRLTKIVCVCLGLLFASPLALGQREGLGGLGLSIKESLANSAAAIDVTPKNVTIVGPAKFVKAIKAHLRAIAKTKTGRALLKDLKKTGKKVKIIAT